MRKIFILLLRAYQLTTFNFAPRCKYYPSCSNYAITAIGRYGFQGFVLSIWRILRCNPWSQGGIDYVDSHLDCADVQKSKMSEQLDSNKPDSMKLDSKKEVVGAI